MPLLTYFCPPQDEDDQEDQAEGAVEEGDEEDSSSSSDDSDVSARLLPLVATPRYRARPCYVFPVAASDSAEDKASSGRVLLLGMPARLGRHSCH